MKKGEQKVLRNIYILICLLFTVNTFSKNITLTIFEPGKKGDAIKNDNRDNPKPSSTSKNTKALTVKTLRTFKSLEKYDTIISTPKRIETKLQEGFNFDGGVFEDKDWLDTANNMFATIEESQNYIDELKDDNLAQLPVAISPIEISNTKYTVGIAKAIFTPTVTKLTVFLKVETARGVLILGAEDVKLSHDGGIVGDAKLNLISKFTININQGKILLALNGSFNEPKTYATIDCFGFKELAIDADVTFSSEVIFPVDDDGKKIDAKQVTGNVKTKVADWNDWVVNVSLPEFGVKGLDGTTFRLNTAVLDFSDLRNDESMPSGYLNTYYGNNPLLWRGVYVNSLEVVLPKAFKKKGKDKRVSFTGRGMIIDESGVTGVFEGNDILSIDEGSASKWKFSLDNFKVVLERNSLIIGAFVGEMLLPVSKETRLKYEAIIQPDEYTFRVAKTEDLVFDVWNAEVVLTEDSYVEMKIKDDKFRPKASLHGSLNIATSLKKEDASASSDKIIQFGGIVFEKLEIQTEAPKFSVAYFGAKGKMGIANFPVSINEIGLELPSGNSAALFIDFNINLTSEQDGGNGGGSRLKINASLEEQDGYERWKYDGIDLERVNIQMSVAGMQLQGAIFIFEDDPTYGKGFAGAVGAKFTTGMSLEVEAKALFGRTDDFRYWFADAQATLPTPIPIFTGFALNSFGGGFYNRMKMDGITRDPDAVFNEIGASTSGVVYKPYNENGFGFKATVGIITQNSEELFHGSLEFGMSFLRSGGLQEVYFKGEGELISSLPGDFHDKLADKLAVISKGDNNLLPAYQPEGRISANVFMELDFVNDSFHASAEVYVNLGVVEGIGSNGRAGWMDIYVDSDEWHVLIGTPDNPIGLELGIGSLKLGTNGYFMTGDNIPGSPPPPPMVASILGLDAADLDYMRDFNTLSSGKGLAFGTHFAMSTGELRFLIFYARFDAGVGFDIMLKDYGEAHCKGSSEPLGLNGWYANGQAYAYLQGSIGLKFKIFGKSKKVTIFSAGGAVLMQARLPNPMWMRGYLAGRYSVLGGLVKGSFRFKVELGEKCEIVGESALEGIVVIGDMAPKEGATGVDVFAAPQVAFNLSINKVFELPDDEGDHKYKIMMDNFDVTKDGQPILGEIEWNYGNDSAVFYSHEILPPNSDVKAYVQLHFEEYLNGRWEIIMDNGKPATETKEVNFTTGEAPKSIPLSNIEYMYPALEQKNFFIKEYSTGYVNLKRGQSYLFDEVPTWKKTITLTSNTGTVINKSFGYNSANKQITYDIKDGISTETTYDVKVTLAPEGTDANNNVSESYDSQTLGTNEDEGNDLEIRSREIGEVATNGQEREMLSFDFGTSRYETFDKKMNAFNSKDNLWQHVTYPYGLTLVMTIDQLEPFDLVELVGNKYSGNKPLVVSKAVLDDSYYKNKIYPLLYQNYPLAGKFSVNRKTDKVGVPPIEGVEPMSWYLTYLEMDYREDLNIYNPYRYNLTHYYHRDYEDLRYQLVSSDISWETMPKYHDLIIKSFPLMKKGTYKTSLQYVLPGQVKNGGNDIVKFTNPLYE